ncbi:TonB-dependent receptor [Pseudacidobacterium ailaaui]|uniref:TonB-dependent receptor n=1 Tax=Pseudacidobacterium ailaaui TaxID=1382359 RepID=UPI0009E01959|nr:TonB-dependent receptor [Pseudacidobacterium ailaaui]
MEQQVVCSAVRRECSLRPAPLSYLIVLVGLILFFFPLRQTQAQAVYGSVFGTVTDSTGAVVPNATVTVTDVSKGTSQQVQTNASGNYTVTHLIPDTYKITVAASGFAQAEADGIAVAADTSPQVNLTLQPAGAAQTVTVTTEAPPLKTDRADVAQVLDSRQIQDLPNLDRNFSQFTLLTPGVQRASFNIAPTENPQGTVATESNGSNYGTVGWLLDGTDNREPVLGLIVINPTLDSISEMKVTSQDYPAEFGGAVGGIVTAQTRSGSNTLHGDVFEFRRSDAQEARDPFTQYQRDPVTGRFIPSSLYNQFGGSLGGPVLKDKAFFFLDYQGVRQRVGTSVQQNVPSMTVRNTCLTGTGTCDLSEYARQIYDPNTGQTYAANAVPASAISPQAINLLKQLPAPQSSGIVNNYVASGNGSNNGDQADLRLDHQVTANLHAFGRYDYANYRLFGAPVFGLAGGTGFGIGNTTGNDQVQNQSVAAGFDWAIHPNLLTDFRFGFLDYHVSQNKYDVGTTPATAAGIPNLNTGAADTSGSPSYDFLDGTLSNFGTQGCNCPLLESEQVFQLVNNWTKIVGNHSFRFGGDIRYAFNLRNASDYNRSGQLTFSQQSTVVTDASGNVVPGSGSDLASLLLGDVGQFQRFDVYSNTAANRQKRGAFYAQDDWRIRPNFTLNYGVRWDIVFPETVNRPGMGGFTDMSTGNIRVAGFGPYGTNANENVDLTNLGGHLGFAWQAKPGTVFRGAVAQVYDDVGFFGTIFGSVLTHNIPVVNVENNNQASTIHGVAYTLTSIPAKPAPFVIPSNGLIPIPANVSPQVRPNTLVLPKVDQWNLSLQQQITNNMTLTLAYVGNVAERIYPGETYGFNMNEPVLPTTPAQLADRDARRPYYNRFTNTYLGQTVLCCSQDITSVAPSARANYNSLQTTLEKRFSSGVQFVANYTWSKAMNYGSTYFAQNPRVEYGPTDTNRNHVFVLSGLYELPFGKNKPWLNTSNRWINYAVGGWQLAGTTTWESGLPFTPTYAECAQDQDIDTNFSTPGASSDCRPDKVPGGSIAMQVGSLNPATHSRSYFSPVAALTSAGASSGPFVRPAFGTIGNIGRNSFRGPNDYFADASLFKNFDITERVKGQFQFQAFNVFNHVPLGLPSASDARCIDCSAGGVITSVDGAIYGSGQPYMRQLQFGARVQF